MRQSLKSIVRAIKRNPVINAFLMAVVIQVLQDGLAGNIDRAHIFGYLGMVCIAVATRMFVTPTREAEDAKANAYMKGLVIPHATPGDELD